MIDPTVQPDAPIAQRAHSKVGSSIACSENGLAVAFAVMNRERLRYVAAWGRWMAWDGTCWRRDESLLALQHAREVCRRGSEAARAVFARRHGDRIGSRLDRAQTAAAVERLARSDCSLSAGPEQWDTDLDLLNTPDGIVDTNTGALLPHRAEAYMTRITAVAPAAPGSACPLWWEFLDRVTAGDADLQFFLQRVAGYALTGHTVEHALFFIHGTGANGKSTFINTLAAMLGSYAEVAPMEAFARSGAAHATALAPLASARLVTAQETEDVRSWSEARIKALTGGDAVTARFPGRACFGFTPQFKLLFAGNRIPGLSHVDEAIRRRCRVIPFSVMIPEPERDPALMRKLRAEYPAILRWAIDGALSWRAMRLATAASVRGATERYLEAEDAFNLWRADCAALEPAAWESVAELYASFAAWAQKAGEAALSQKRFSQVAEAHGFARKRVTGGQRGFVGLKLRRAAAAQRDRLETAIAAVEPGMCDSAG
jgi:putative DNA primase/helicase